MAYKTRVKCFAKLLLEFYANAKRAISANEWNFRQPKRQKIAAGSNQQKTAGQLH
jgi:hypothetical protein